MLPGSWWDSACRCRSSSVVNLPTEAISCGSEPGGVLVEICWLMDYFFISSIPGRNRTNYVVLSLKTCVLGKQKLFLQAKQLRSTTPLRIRTECGKLCGAHNLMQLCLFAWLYFRFVFYSLQAGSWSPVTDALVLFELTELWCRQMLSK